MHTHIVLYDDCCERLRKIAIGVSRNRAIKVRVPALGSHSVDHRHLLYEVEPR